VTSVTFATHMNNLHLIVLYPSKSFSDSTKLEVYSLLHSTTTAEAQSHENELPYQLKLKETLSIQDKIVDLQKPTHESESELILCKLDSGQRWIFCTIWHTWN